MAISAPTKSHVVLCHPWLSSVSNFLLDQNADLISLSFTLPDSFEEGQLIISDNPLLERLQGMEELSAIDTLTIEANPQLLHLGDLLALGHINSLEVRGNARLNAASLPNLETAQWLTIQSNHREASSSGGLEVVFPKLLAVEERI